ncbi:Riboflavin kinase [Giardia muris]|uniref:riboflavin kinase n=1 Tax=Giardia muris TaxID=5742 RepID=A0A4Z1TAT2_GIAMU|nr:Riboflavin kinase [Giardia muris]|eukprot:TNJ30337.1 Riboflavin kinase [Giardia muris]
MLALKGVVIKGFQRGRTINCKTANILVPDSLGLEDGVYSGWARVGHGDAHLAVISYCMNPTFNGTKRSLEVHVLYEYPDDFYGETLYLYAHGLLRTPIKFGSIEELKAQIMKDIRMAKDQLGSVPDIKQIALEKWVKLDQDDSNT